MHDIVQRHHVEDFAWRRYGQHTTTRPGRASQDRTADEKEAQHATVDVRVDEAAMEAAVRQVGWRIYRTKQPGEQRAREPAVLV